MRDFDFELGDALDALDAAKLRLERLESLSFDRGLVHAARVEVADLLLVRALGRHPIFRRPLQNLAQDLAVPLLELAEPAPTGVLGRYGIFRQPSAVGVFVEVGAGLTTPVDARDVQTVNHARGGARCSGKRGRVSLSAEGDASRAAGGQRDAERHQDGKAGKPQA